MRAAALACGLLLAAFAFAGGAAASEQHPTQGELEAELVCPSCHVPLDESQSDVAQQMKSFIRAHIALGWTKSHIESALAAQLGDGIYGVPRTHGFDLIAWVLPIGGILLGALGVGGGAWYWSRGRDDGSGGGERGVPDAGLDAESEQRLDEALARFDG